MTQKRDVGAEVGPPASLWLEDGSGALHIAKGTVGGRVVAPCHPRSLGVLPGSLLRRMNGHAPWGPVMCPLGVPEPRGPQLWARSSLGPQCPWRVGLGPDLPSLGTQPADEAISLGCVVSGRGRQAAAGGQRGRR